MSKYTAELALQHGFTSGFVAATKWSEPVSQDVNSIAFIQECKEFVKKNASLYEATMSAGSQVPYGWKLVPIEPTHEMCGAPDVVWHPEAKRIYQQMLAAAPTTGAEGKV